MDFRNTFRSFFRFNQSNEDLFNETNSHFSNDFKHFDHFESETNRQFEDIFQDFSQMFEIFNRFSIINDLNDSNRWQELETEPKSPRDLMIKSNEDNRKEDIDFDDRVAENGLNSILTEKPKYESKSKSKAIRSPIETKSFRKTYFYSSLNNNERFEEQKRTEDQFGNCETSVTQRIGDRVLTQVFKTNDKNEIIEKKEIFENMDENDLNDFKRNFSKNEEQIGSENPINRIGFEDNPNANSLFKRLLDFSFRF